MRSGTQAPELLERGAELTRIRELLLRARAGAGSLAVLSAPAGVGKSALLRAARDEAAAGGFRVLRGIAGELDAGFPFGVARQLVEPALRDAAPARRDELLGGSAALAGRLFGDDGSSPDLDAVVHGLFWLISNLTDDGPLVLCVDDAHWCDVPTARALAYLAPRLEGLPILLLVATRPAEPGPAMEVVQRLVADPAGERLDLHPLSVEATTALVRDGLGEAAATAFCRACHAATGGNPFFVRELLRAVQRAAVEPTDENATKVTEVGPATVGRWVAVRLQGLPPAATAVARAVAILGDEAQLRHAAALSGLEASEAGEAADALAAITVLRAGRPLGFVHAIVRAAIVATMTPAERDALHRAAARLLHDDGADPSAVALHLRETEPVGDPWVVDRLVEATDAAFATGAIEIAAGHLERALAEPPPPAARPALHYRLAHAETRLLRPTHVERLRDAAAAQTDPLLRAAVARDLVIAMGLADDPVVAVELADDELARLPDPAAPEATRLQIAVIDVARMHTDLRPVVRERVALLGEQVDPEDPEFGFVLAANRAREHLAAADPAETTLAEARRALELRPRDDRPLYEGAPCFAIITLMQGGALAEALRWCDEMVTEAQRRGDVHGFALGCQYRAQTQLRVGALREAEADARLSLAALQGSEALIAWNSRHPLGMALLARGELDEAATLFDGRDLPHTIIYANALAVRGYVNGARGAWEDSLSDHLASGLIRTREDHRNPGISAWRSAAALAHLHLGDREAAIAVSADEVGIAREYGGLLALGIALRTHGLVLAGSDGVEVLREAVALLEGAEGRADHAEALVELGATLRRAGKRADAREPLREGADLADRCGALVLRNRAREELVASGARPRRTALTGLESLTPSERRVCELAAEGLTNREIAQALFVTIKTIEDHLRNSYGKLGVAGKKDLPAVMRGTAAL